MSRVSGGDTKPEIIVRKILHAMGYRFRLHVRELPGTPDIVLPRHRKIIFVHGCFWHGHENCSRAKRPTSNRAFWDEKINANIRRDKDAVEKLLGEGWNVLTLWECQMKSRDNLLEKLKDFL